MDFLLTHSFIISYIVAAAVEPLQQEKSHSIGPIQKTQKFPFKV